MQALVDPREQPEEQAERCESAPRQRERGRRELGRDPGQAAGQRVANDEEKRHRHGPAAQGLHPGPVPPSERVTRRDRAEHEQGQAGNVQRAVQWYAGADRRGRRVAQRVERLPHGSFLSQGEEARPQPGAQRDQRPAQDQRRRAEHQRAPSVNRRT